MDGIQLLVHDFCTSSVDQSLTSLQMYFMLDIYINLGLILNKPRHIYKWTALMTVVLVSRMHCSLFIYNYYWTLTILA